MLLGFHIGANAQCISGPCILDVQANKTTICAGDSVVLTAYSGTASLANDFNGSSIGNGWVTANNVVNFNNPCGPGLDGTPHVWFGSLAGTGTRLLQTIDFNTTLGGNICFDFKMAQQGGSNPCEGPDEGDEGVSLQYSINQGATWVDITYFSPSGVLMPSNPGGNTSVTPAGGVTPFTSWANYSFPMPAAAMTPSTRFRWFQPYNTSASNDHWGIDNVSVITNIATAPNPGFVWTDNGQMVNGARVVSPTQTTTYTAQRIIGTDTCTDFITIVVNPVPATPAFVAPQICSGQSFSLTPTNPIQGATYYWSGTNGMNSNAVPYTAVGGASWDTAVISLYVVANGCTSSAASNVLSLAIPPAVSVVGPTSACEGTLVTLTANPSNLDSVIWSNGATGNVIQALAGSNYIANGWKNGCRDTGLINVTTIPNPLTISGNTPFCQNRSVTLTATSGKVAYIWNGMPGGTTMTLNGNSPNPSFLTVESQNGCIRTDTIHLNVLAIPVVDFEPKMFCGGLVIPFNNLTTIDTANGASIAGYAWNFGDGNISTLENPTHSFATGGTYNMSLIAFSSQSCMDTLEVPFNAFNKPEANFNAVPLCFGLYHFSDSTKLGDGALATYQWTMDVTTDTVIVPSFDYQFGETVSQVTIHYLVVDSNGCSDDTTKTIQIEDPPQFSKLPNIITPNEDGLNDFFEIPSSFDKCYEYSIRFFNRWGQKVYDITHSSMKFDGRNSMSGKFEDGVYYYVIMADGKKVLNGTVTVISGSK